MMDRVAVCGVRAGSERERVRLGRRRAGTHHRCRCCCCSAAALGQVVLPPAAQMRMLTLRQEVHTFSLHTKHMATSRTRRTPS